MSLLGTKSQQLNRPNRTKKSRKSHGAKNRRRAVAFEPLEQRLLLTRNFLEVEPANDTFPGQPVEHFPPAEVGVVDSSSLNASIGDGDQDHYNIKAAVNGQIMVRAQNLGNDPDGQSDSEALVLKALNSAGVELASWSLPSGDTVAATAAVNAGDDFWVRVEGATATADADYEIRFTNIDREDNGGNNNSRGSATNLGTLGSFNPADLLGYTITRPDRDYFQFTVPANTPGPIEVRAVMPDGSGAQTGADSPTNLGVRIRTTSGAILSTSNGTTTDVDVATVVAGTTATTYFVEVYSGSVGQVNRYDLEIERLTGEIKGFKFLDNNGDTFQDFDEPAVPGWTIFLDTNDNGVPNGTEPITTTAADGSYSFSGLAPGVYNVREVLPAAYVQTLPGAADALKHVISINRDNLLSDHIDFGNYEGGKISGVKFNDLNGDGVKDTGEPGLNGWTIYIDDDNDGVLDATERRTTTASDGSYQFIGVPFGTHVVRELVASGWQQTHPTPVPPGSHTVTITTPAQDETDIDFGNFDLIVISGQKFDDKDGDGVQEAGDTGIQNWTIQLYRDANGDGLLDGGDTLVTTRNTDSNGNYTFTNVGPGTYFVREVLQGGWMQTTADPAPIVAASGSDVAGVNFGNFRLISISGQKFGDTDGDAVKDTTPAPGELGLQGWTIFLDDDNNGVLDTGETSTTTDANGNYSFPGLGPGTYRVREELQTDWQQTTGNPADITSVSGVNVANVLFGNFELFDITGTKYEDTDGDGNKDAGEPGVPGWTIYLDDNNNGALDTGETSTATDTDGNYTFPDLGPGIYRVREVSQAGWEQTSANPAQIAGRSGVDIPNVNFGNFERVTLNGTKFEDTNANGNQDAGEPGIGNWEIFNDANGNGSRDGAEIGTLTAADGSYNFTVGPGTFRIRETLKLGWTQTTGNPADIVTQSGQNVPGVDFGNFDLISISGQKFADVNGNGAKDAGEPGLQDWEIFLDLNFNGSKDTGEPTATTDAAGDYIFNNIGPGTYRVREVLKTGFVQTTPDPSDIVALSGQDATDVDFGNFGSVPIAGMKFKDVNGDGIRDADGIDNIGGNADDEAGLSGWTIRLYRDANDNGNLDDPETANTTTDANGNYIFPGLGPGKYFVREDLQTGWMQTTPGANAPPVDPGVSVTFGNFETIDISGVKFDDADGDGVKDAGEVGLPGWTIFLDANNNGSLDGTEPSDTTGANGNYTFTNLGPGTYRVREALQTGWVQTTSPVDIQAQSGQDETVNVGNFEKITISGMKFEDTDGDGTKDAGETGLSGWTIFVDANNNGSLDGGEANDTTDTNGNYSFADLGPGTYRVREVLQNGWEHTTLDPDVTPTSGNDVPGVDFGNFKLVTINGMKFEDKDGGGTKDTGETGISGWTIFLDANNNGSLDIGEDSTATDANGNYSFTGLEAGTYRVREVPQTGWQQTTADPADINGTSGTAATGVDFGNFNRFSISGMKFGDTNGNGAMDTGETGISGWTIFLDANNNGSLDAGETRTTTGTNGNYSFADLGPGTYRVREVPKLGWTQTTTNPADIVGESGVNRSGIDFGNSVAFVFFGQKFHDVDESGSKNTGEPGLDNWTIELYKDVDGDGELNPNGPFGSVGVDGAPIETTTTFTGVDNLGNPVSGLYNIGNSTLASGKYLIREVQPQGWRQTTSPASHAIDFNGNTVDDLDFGNTTCSDRLYVGDGSSHQVDAERVGILTIMLSQGTFDVKRSGTGGAFKYFDPGTGSLVETTDPDHKVEDVQEIHILIDPQSVPLNANSVPELVVDGIAGSGGNATLTVVNAVNVDTAGTLALQIQGTACGDFIAVDDDNGGAESDAKAIFIGTVNDTNASNDVQFNGGAANPLYAKGVKYDSTIIDAMFGDPTISRVEINGNEGDDIIRVTDDIKTQQSTLNGGGGNDNIRGGRGKGTIFGGSGHDLLIGGAADDVLNGGDGHDRIFGGAGADRAFGAGGNDWIAGGDGNDPLLRGGNGDDRISGGVGRDRLLGDAGFDWLYRDGSDLLVSAGAGGGTILNTPPDPVESALKALLEEFWNDLNADANDTLDELIDSIIP